MRNWLIIPKEFNSLSSALPAVVACGGVIEAVVAVVLAEVADVVGADW